MGERERGRARGNIKEENYSLYFNTSGSSSTVSRSWSVFMTLSHFSFKLAMMWHASALTADSFSNLTARNNGLKVLPTINVIKGSNFTVQLAAVDQ